VACRLPYLAFDVLDVLRVTCALLLFLSIGCSPSPSANNGTALARQILPERVKGYIASVLTRLHDNPKMTDSEFKETVADVNLTEDFIDPSGYYSHYDVLVSSNKKLWVDSAKTKKPVALVIVKFKEPENKTQNDLYFTYTAELVGADAIPDEGHAQFVPLRIERAHRLGR
jgi:hypothetical protein